MRLKTFAMIIVILGFISGCASKSNSPMSAEGMSEDDRAKNDTAVLLEGLTELGAEKVEINYARDAVKVYINKESTAQYASDDASNIRGEVATILNEKRSELTLEKESYDVYIYGSDRRLIWP